MQQTHKVKIPSGIPKYGNILWVCTGSHNTVTHYGEKEQLSCAQLRAPEKSIDFWGKRRTLVIPRSLCAALASIAIDGE